MFPGADAAAQAADYAVVGAPLDVSASFRPGARFGPARIREHARCFEDYDRATDARFSALGVHDHGDVRAWPDAADYLDFLAGTLEDHVAAGRVPLLLGGEHTVSVAGVRAVDPDVFVALDAHLDLRDSYDGEPYSHATVTHHALETADRAVILGARAGSEAEYDRAAAPDVELVRPAGVAGWEPADAGLTDPATTVYCSVDLDVADPAVVPATGTPEPGGLDARTCRSLVRSIAPHAAGADVVEVTDRDDGQTALLAAKLLRDVVYAHADGAD